MSNPFEAALRSGRFVVTCELECPRGASAENVARQARAYRGLVDAVNCTDNSAAVARMSPVAAAAIAAREGVAPLAQLTCRDRNRIALQSDLLGAAAVGAAGVVCMWGDPVTTGNHPDAKAVYDLDTLGLIRAAAGLRAGRFLSGDTVRGAPHLVIGAVTSPSEPASIERLRAKADAGAAFVQTQIGFDSDRFDVWMRDVRAAGLHERLRIFAGVAPVRRLSIARYLRDSVPGIETPPWLFEQLEATDDVETSGVAIAARYLRDMRSIPGVAGAHIMTFGWAAGVRRVLEQAGMAEENSR